MIDDRDIEYLKQIFVTRDECADNTHALESRQSKDLVRISVIETKLNIIMGLIAAIGTGVLGVLVKMIFGG